MIIRTQAFARAGLIGNPSDGYFGKTISFIVRNFRAEVVLYETPELEILPNTRDQSSFASIAALAQDVRLFGYYGGIRLLKATIKRFYDYCQEQGIELHDRNFTLRYHTNIPSRVGLAGSSAIITACLRALMAFYGVSIPRHVQPNLILSVETQELGIPAGLQDRVIQVYEGLVYMDFDRQLMERQGYGRLRGTGPAPPAAALHRLPHRSRGGHGGFPQRHPQPVQPRRAGGRGGDEILGRPHRPGARTACSKRRGDKIGPLLDATSTSAARFTKISEGNLRMVEAARAAGASAKFPGSGGAIVGTYPDEAMFERLQQRLGAMGVKVFKPVILPEN